MKIVIAADSFKGCLSAIEVGESIMQGILQVLPQCEISNIPVADGGEGTVAAMLYSGGGEIIAETVTGPMRKPVRARYGLLQGGTAVIEMSAASGLPLVGEDERNPLAATSYGTGELIKSALDRGCASILLGIGGSATNDGGAGMAQALGVSLLDKDGMPLGPGGRELFRLTDIDMSGIHPRLNNCKITVACDVDNPLCGDRGASAVYGPQKGADPNMVGLLDNALLHYASVIKIQLGADVAGIPGAGAAGGLGAGLMAFCGASISRGIDTVLDCIGFEQKLSGADLVITGEGRIDYQTAFGKAPTGVARRAKKYGDIPVIAIAGSIGAGAEAVYSEGIDAFFSIAPGPISLEYSKRHTRELLSDAARGIIRTFVAGVNARR